MTKPIPRQTDILREIGPVEIGAFAARLFTALVGLAFAALCIREWSHALPAALAERPRFTAGGGLLARNSALREGLHALEDSLREHAWLTRRLVPAAVRFKADTLKLGTESVIVGVDGWLHFARDIEALAARTRGAQLDRAIHCILHFAGQLRDRGIHLVVVPVPPKTALVPDTLSPRARSPVSYPALEILCAALEQAGISVVRPEQIWQTSRAKPPFLRSDTHWDFQAMDEVARAIAGLLKKRFLLSPGAVRYARDSVTIDGEGDLARILYRSPSTFGRGEKQEIAIVRDGDLAWHPRAGSAVLLLGDSFSNIFSREELGWGEGAGLAEQVSFHLGQPVDRIVRNDGGPTGARETLARELARGRNRLDGTKVVVWQFAARDLSGGDWRPIILPAPKESPPSFVDPPQHPAVWTATVAALSAIPVPGRVPYDDHIAALHLADIEGAAEGLTEAYAFAFSITNRQRTTVARLRPGDRITAKVIDWRRVADRLEGIQRSELDDPIFLAANPIWIEEILERR